MKNTFYLNIESADNLGVGLFKYSILPKEKFIIFNSTLPLILGYSSKVEFKKLKFSELFFNRKDNERFFSILKEKKNIRFFETLFKNKNTLWIAITASYIAMKNGEYVEGIIEDISQHKEMQEKLILERDLMQNLLDNIPDAIYFKDRYNRIIKVNKFYTQGTGLRVEEIIGKTDFDFFPYEQARQMFEDDNYVLKTGRPIVGKIERTLLRNGSWNQVITTKVPLYDHKGKIIGTMGITRDMTSYANLEHERINMLINTITVLNKALEMRDPYTAIHTRNVAYISSKIAENLGWDENRILAVRLAAELHDLGKIGIPLEILNKSGRLNELEYSLIQQHVKNCYDLIKDINFPFSLAEIVYQHHERLDGSGYPRHLKEEQILPEARILAISDVLESITSYRPYREALGLERALEELQRGKGKKYDSKLVSIVFSLIERNNGQAFWFLSS
ncbi:MAG: PAS domain S-box protein [Candidatus Omnitrophica bacterium]|nr:PAS domain S-box protein [Candidatus Omnitrophota bacterium]